MRYLPGTDYHDSAVHRSSAVDAKPTDMSADTAVDGIELTARTESVEEPLIH